jgi:hypothetical protein
MQILKNRTPHVFFIRKILKCVSQKIKKGGGVTYERGRLRNKEKNSQGRGDEREQWIG